MDGWMDGWMDCVTLGGVDAGSTQPQPRPKGQRLNPPSHNTTQHPTQALHDLDAAPPAVRLLEDYFRLAPDSPEFRGRFKAMAQVGVCVNG